MIYVINSNNHPLLEEAYALRAKILHDRLGWKVTVIDGKEMDELDDLPPTHFLYLDEKNDPKGYMRLIPTTGATMLRRYFSEVFKEELVGPSVWEISKFCLDVEKTDLAFYSAIMMAGLGQFCWRNCIETVTGIVGKKTLTAYNRGGINVRIIEQALIDGQPSFNIAFQMTKDNLKTMQAWFGDRVLDEATLVHA